MWCHYNQATFPLALAEKKLIIPLAIDKLISNETHGFQLARIAQSVAHWPQKQHENSHYWLTRMGHRQFNSQCAGVLVSSHPTQTPLPCNIHRVTLKMLNSYSANQKLRNWVEV